MVNAVIVDLVRSPMARGKPGGALSLVHPVDLLAAVIHELLSRNDIDPALVDDVVVGCVTQYLEQSGSPGRQAWLSAGFPTHVPSTTVERKCGSGQQAVDFATFGVMAGAYDLVIAAGVESMSRVPMGSNRGNADPFGPRVRQRFPDLGPQGVSAELVAHKYGLSRDDLDSYSVRSHQRSEATRVADGFERELVSITRPDGVVVGADETIRPDSSVERLAKLDPAFVTDERRERLPHIDWKVTAGNSSQITDGASAILIMSEQRAEQLGLTPRARIVATAVCGDDPVMMLTGPMPATRKVLDRAGMSIAQIDTVEINEAFASVPLAWMQEFEIDPEVVNPRGGAIAMGHPLGASGGRLLTSLVTHLETTGGRYGLQTICEAGGMANAFIVERLG